jgi:DNA-cytosine methyltransferase
MNVLSLFDGMSCAQIALERAGIKVDKYFASEIDKYAMQVTQANYPNTIQVGNVEFVTKEMLNNKIDFLAGGSPCQGFSFAGKQLNFEDPRSKLFFEFVRLKNELKPKYFLLENVRMKKEYQDIITAYLGCEPIVINSSLVSAQNRVRLYWTNILDITQPLNKGFILNDILENNVDQKYFYNENQKSKMQLSGTNQEKDIKIIAHRKGYRRNSQIFDSNGKTECIDTGQGGGRVIGTQIKRLGNVNPSGKGMNGEVYAVSGKSPTLTTNKGEGTKISLFSKKEFRKLTPIECERLQTVPDNYTNHVSNSQRYKMLGNGWTVDVIAHILKNIKL